VKPFIVVLGLLTGLLLGLALLLLNPITVLQGKPAPLTGAVRTFSWAGADYRGLDMTPAGLLGAARISPGLRDFRDPASRYARAEIINLATEGEETPLLAVRLSALARPNSLLRARLGVVTAWNIVWSGERSVMAAGSENFWLPLRDGLWSALRGRGFHPGRPLYPLPAVPGLGVPRLIGGAGEFAGRSGGFREEFSAGEEPGTDLIGIRQLHLALE